MKLVRLDPKYWPDGGYGHWCPGCNCGHEINVDAPNADGAKWAFNGDMERPSFTPSIHLKINPVGHKNYQPGVRSTTCHYFITDGEIRFCADCSHDLAGKNRPLPDLPPHAYRSAQYMAMEDINRVSGEARS